MNAGASLCRYCSTPTDLLDSEQMPVCVECEIIEPTVKAPKPAPPPAKPMKPGSPNLADWRAHMVSAVDLQEMTFSPPAAYIDGLIFEGLGILGGKPKLGKSWLALSAAVTIATGGIAFGNPQRQVTKAPVFYLALEDGAGRLQRRMHRFFGPGEKWPADLRLTTTWPRLDLGGIDLLGQAVDADGCHVVFIDTLARVRPPKKGRDSYQEDSDAMSAVHDLARSRPGLAVWVVHHLNKSLNPEDYTDSLSGTTGIAGVVDHIAVLQRVRGEADGVVRFTSRDAAEADTAYSYNDGLWSELGSAAEHAMSKERRELLAHLRNIAAPITLKELAGQVGKKEPTVLHQLRGLEGEGLARQIESRGAWEATEHP